MSASDFIRLIEFPESSPLVNVSRLAVRKPDEFDVSVDVDLYMSITLMLK